MLYSISWYEIAKIPEDDGLYLRFADDLIKFLHFLGIDIIVLEVDDEGLNFIKIFYYLDEGVIII